MIESITATAKKRLLRENRHVPGKYPAHDGKAESSAFKEATKATDCKIMNSVIHDCCEKIDMRNYGTNWML